MYSDGQDGGFEAEKSAIQVEPPLDLT